MSNSDFLAMFPNDDATGENAVDPADTQAPLMSTELNQPPQPVETENLEEFSAIFNELLSDECSSVDDPNGLDLPQDTDVAIAFESMVSDDAVSPETVDWFNRAASAEIEQPLEDPSETDYLFDTDETNATASPLLPPFLHIHQQLQQQVETLNQQLNANQRRLESSEQLIEQQAADFTQVQEKLTHTVAELQVHQEENKRQRLQVETLTEQLAQHQAQLSDLTQAITQKQAQIAQLEEQVAHPVQSEEQTALIANLEQHIQELRSRLQRQQRFALQYKSALEQCLAQPGFQPSSDVSLAIANLTGQATAPPPWMSVGEILQNYPQTPAGPEPLTTVEETPQSTPVQTQPMEATSATVAPLASDQESTPGNTENSEPTQPMPATTPVTVTPSRHEQLSFAVQERDKKRRKSIELPSFLRRATPSMG